MKRFRIVIWKWRDKLADLIVEFKTDKEANTYAMGIYNGMNHQGAEATGYKAEEIGYPRNKFIVNQRTGNAQLEICESLYNDKDKGISAVYDYANKVQMPYTHCEPCETETPTVVMTDNDLCALCSSDKPKQSNYK